MRTLITITPLGRASFRWYGTSSPMLRGPMTAMVSEPVPLPTTVAGALNWVFGGGPREGKGLDELHRSLMRVLGCREGAVMKGPYVLVHKARDPTDWVATCFHSMGGEFLLCVERGGDEFIVSKEGVQTQSVGVSIDRASKAVIEGWIYTQTTTDYRAIAREVRERLGASEELAASVAVEVDCGISKAPVKPVARFGGEGFLARFAASLLNGPTPSEEVSRGECAYVATPLLLSEPGEDIVELARSSPRDAVKEVAKLLGVRGPDPATSRIIVGLAPTGYDVAGGRPRPTYPSIMPGTYVCGAGADVPKPQWLGYGTVIALPKKAFNGLRR